MSDKWSYFYGRWSIDAYISNGDERMTLAESCQYMNGLEAQLAEARKLTWRPIETAPQEGFVLVARKYTPYPLIVKWNSQFEQFELCDGELLYHLTHWMPLPQMPAGRGE